MSTRACPHCHGAVLRGYDNDVAGIPVTLDAAPVDNLGEALALVQGRRTFDVRTTRDGLSLRRVFEPRTARAISDSLNRVLRRRIHAEHLCGQSLPAADTTVSTDWNQEPAF